MELKYEKNRIYSEDGVGKTIAELTYTNTSTNTVNIDHTFVDKSLRGQGVAGKLMTALTEELKRNNIKATATCSYAKDWFEKHTEFDDIYLCNRK